MALPILTGTGRLTSDGELRYTPAGKPVYTCNLAFNSRKRDANGEWQDDDVMFVRGTLFAQAAENAAESFRKGMEVVVTGRLKTDQWEDRETGQKRSAVSLLVDAIGPVVRNAPVKVLTADRSSGVQEQDPWATASATTSEPPF